MKATIEIDINVDKKYGHTTLSFGPGKTIASDIWEDEFNSVATITEALKEIMMEYVNKDIKRSLDIEEEDD